MRVQNINQSPIYSVNDRQERSVSFSGKCRPKPKSQAMDYRGLNQSADSFSPAFKGKRKQAQGLLSEIGNLITDTCKAVKHSYDNSKTKEILVAPLQKKWSDFASKAPKLSQAVKGAVIVTAGVTAFDAVRDSFK